MALIPPPIRSSETVDIFELTPDEKAVERQLHALDTAELSDEDLIDLLQDNV